jgi:hypothetical protein
MVRSKSGAGTAYPSRAPEFNNQIKIQYMFYYIITLIKCFCYSGWWFVSDVTVYTGSVVNVHVSSMTDMILTYYKTYYTVCTVNWIDLECQKLFLRSLNGEK